MSGPAEEPMKPTGAEPGPVPPQQRQYIHLSTLSYNGPVPRPHPPVTDPTPDIQFRQYLDEQRTAMDQQQQEMGAQAASTTDNGTGSTPATTSMGGMGFFADAAAKLNALAQNVALQVERRAKEVTTVTEARLRQVDFQRGQERFNTFFPELATQEFIAEYPCSVMHAGAKVSGFMQLTRELLLFISPPPQLEAIGNQIAASVRESNPFARGTAENTGPLPNTTQATRPNGIREVIPLTAIASIQLSLALDTLDDGPPYFLPIPSPTVQANALQVYTCSSGSSKPATDGGPHNVQIFQFLAFETLAATAAQALAPSMRRNGRPIDRAYNYLDHTWRAATTVPQPAVTYAD